MKRIVTAFGASIGAVAILFACSSGGGSAANATGFESEFCNLIGPCCAGAGLHANATQCEAVINAFTGSAPYNATAGQACIDGLQKESNAGTICKNVGNDVPSCNQVFAGSGGGSVQPGGACTKNSDCASSGSGSVTCFDSTTFLDGGGSTSTRTCVQEQTGKAGDSPCIGTRSGNVTTYSWFNGAPPGVAYICDLANGSHCDGTTNKCVALAQTGQACTNQGDCTSADYCAFQDGGQSCEPRIPNGGACTSYPDGCQSGSSCKSNVCTAGLPNQAPCSQSLDCASGSCVNGACSGNGSSSFGLGLYCAK